MNTACNNGLWNIDKLPTNSVIEAGGMEHFRLK